MDKPIPSETEIDQSVNQSADKIEEAIRKVTPKGSFDRKYINVFARALGDAYKILDAEDTIPPEGLAVGDDRLLPFALAERYFVLQKVAEHVGLSLPDIRSLTSNLSLGQAADALTALAKDEKFVAKVAELRQQIQPASAPAPATVTPQDKANALFGE